MQVIGRARELALIEAFLEADRPGAGAIVFRGGAGIGKTTLWHAALAAAAGRGHRVVTTRPTEAEARLPFAGLSDLVGPILDGSGVALPPPQRDALELALMRRTAAPDEAVQPLALSLATLELLRGAAADRPVVIAIDDVQWLDDSTAAVLRFALRRIERAPIALVVSERIMHAGPRSEITDDLPVDRVVDVEVVPLDAAGIDELLVEALGLDLRPTVVRRVHAMSGGNPLYAVEIGRAIRDRDLGRDGDRLPLPESLGELLRERVAALPADAQAVVVHVAALSKPARRTLAAALGDDRADAGISAARAAGVLAPDDPPRLAHPLIGAEAYAGLNDDERRELHGRLAAVVTEPEELGRHLALATDGPDAGVADALDTAADHAQRRGAIESAADLSELAATRTAPTDPARARRLARSGRFRLMSGDTARARDLLERALDMPAAASGPGRAELLVALAMVRQLMDDFRAAAALGTEALEHTADDAALAIQIKLVLAGVSYITGLDWADGARHASEAMELAESLGDPRILAGTIGHHATWRYATGRGHDRELERRAAALEPSMGHLRTLDRPDFDFAAIHLMEGEVAEAHATTRRLLVRAEEDGDYSSLPFLLGNVALVEFVEGRTAESRDILLRAERMAAVTEQSTARVHNLVHRGRIEARLGAGDAARRAGHEAFRVMDETGWRISEWLLRADLALLELSRRDPEAALTWAGDAAVPAAPDPTGRRAWARPAAIEAFLATGRIDEARAVLETLRVEAEGSGAQRIVAELHRARARVEAAAGNLDEATDAIDEAERLHRRFGDPWELARTLLAAGEIHRRSRRRAKAREALAEAVEAFDRIGAEAWAGEARDQLGRIGGSRGEGGLTPTQREVATLVATGLTNRQVADRLFMSPHTVEAHLSAVYRSLDIRSRTELDAALARDAATPRDSEPAPRDSADEPVRED